MDSNHLHVFSLPVHVQCTIFFLTSVNDIYVSTHLICRSLLWLLNKVQFILKCGYLTQKAIELDYK